MRQTALFVLPDHLWRLSATGAPVAGIQRDRSNWGILHLGLQRDDNDQVRNVTDHRRTRTSRREAYVIQRHAWDGWRSVAAHRRGRCTA